MRQIEDGIEVVPFERCNSTSAPILSPDQGEKEVFIVSQTEEQAVEKPLPNLPRCPWQRMSLRQRILGLLGIQMIMLLTIGLALMAVKNALSQQYEVYIFWTVAFLTQDAATKLPEFAPLVMTLRKSIP